MNSGPAQVEHVALHPPDAGGREFLLDDARLADRGEIVDACSRHWRCARTIQSIWSPLKASSATVVAVIVVPQQVEIVLADIDRDILAPVILDPLQHQGTAGVEFLDPVGPDPSGISSVVALTSRFLPWASVPSHQCLGSTVEFAGYGRQFAVAGAVEGEQ